MIDGDGVARRKLEDIAKECHRGRRHDEREVVPESGEVHFGRYLGMREQRADLRRKQPFPGGRLREVERLDAHAVTHEVKQWPAIAGIVDPGGKHAAELLEAVQAPFFVGMQQHFGVRVIGLPLVFSDRRQFQPELGVVVDLAVERDSHGSRGVQHRLRGGVRQIDDRQASVAERAATVRREPQADTVGTAMGHPVPHRLHDVGSTLAAEGFEATGDSTHGVPLPLNQLWVFPEFRRKSRLTTSLGVASKAAWRSPSRSLSLPS